MTPASRSLAPLRPVSCICGLGSARPGRPPPHGQLSFMSRAITQVEIDQRLAGNLGLVRQSPKIGDRAFIQPDRHGAFEAL